MKTLLCLLLSFAGAAAADPLLHTWQEVAPGVHVGIRDDSPRTPVMGTTTFVVGEAGVVVFDGGGLPLMAERAIDRIRSVTDKPVTHVVISHWHQDHLWGLGAFADAYPEAAIVAHPATRDTLARRGPSDDARARTQMERIRASVRELLARDDITAGRRQRAERLLADADLLEREYQRLRTVTPTLTVDERLVLDGGRVEILHLGRGNTDGDLLLWLPRERIVASGDLVVRPTPYGFGSYPGEWAQTLRRLNALDYRLLVPGHGDLQRDTGYVDLLIETLESVATQMAALVAAGKDEEAAVAALDFSAVEPRFTGGDPYLATLFRNWFKQPIGQAAYRIASGGSPELPVP